MAYTKNSNIITGSYASGSLPEITVGDGTNNIGQYNASSGIIDTVLRNAISAVQSGGKITFLPGSYTYNGYVVNTTQQSTTFESNPTVGKGFVKAGSNYGIGYSVYDNFLGARTSLAVLDSTFAELVSPISVDTQPTNRAYTLVQVGFSSPYYLVVYYKRDLISNLNGSLCFRTVEHGTWTVSAETVITNSVIWDLALVWNPTEGNYGIFYTLDGSNYIYGLRISTAGSIISGPTQLTNISGAHNFAVGLDGSGAYVLFFTTGGDALYGRFVGADVTPTGGLGTATLLDTGYQLQLYEHQYVEKQGSLYYFCLENAASGESVIVATDIVSASITVSSTIAPSTTERNPRLINTGKDLIVAWKDNRGFIFKRANYSPELNGNEIIVGGSIFADDHGLIFNSATNKLQVLRHYNYGYLHDIDLDLITNKSVIVDGNGSSVTSFGQLIINQANSRVKNFNFNSQTNVIKSSIYIEVAATGTILSDNRFTGNDGVTNNAGANAMVSQNLYNTTTGS